jgi:septal ring factor EnvC (AmiA/AmiB activator)
MIKPFKGNFPLTQGFGLNPDIYKQFGMAGHNGIDMATPSGTPILASISGRVIEAVKSGDVGYGKYVKIESDKWGSLTAHLSRVDVEIGQEVTEGQQVGLSGNTGFSTGPHLHWGVFPIPRDRNNGYAGYIDQTSLITEPNDDTIPVNKKTFEELVKKATEYDKFSTAGYASVDKLNDKIAELNKQVHDIGIQLDAVNAQLKHNDEFLQELAALLNCTKSEGEIVKAINEDFSHAESVEKLTKELASAKSETVEATQKASELQERLSTATDELTIVKNTLNHQTTAYNELEKKYKEQLKLNQLPDWEINLLIGVIRFYGR